MPWDLSCDTSIRSLFVLLCWPLSMRPRQHDRFVHIGLCWLYGRGEFPPPFPPEFLSDNIHDALGNPGCCNWATGVQQQCTSVDMTSELTGGCVHNIDHLAFRKAMLVRDMSVWEGLHILPRDTPSEGAKLSISSRRSAQPTKVNTQFYYGFPLPVTKLRSILHFGWVLAPCRLSRAGLECPRYHDICANAHFVRPSMLSAVSAIMSSVALELEGNQMIIFRAFGNSMQGLSMKLMMLRDLPCDSRTRCLSVPVWRSLSMRARQHDRCVLIGTFYTTSAVGDERPCVFNCPRFQGLWQQHAGMFQDYHDAMWSFLWHREQKSVLYSALHTVLHAADFTGPWTAYI